MRYVRGYKSLNCQGGSSASQLFNVTGILIRQSREKSESHEHQCCSREVVGKTVTDNSPTRLHVTFIDKDGDEHTFEVSEGDNLLDIAQANDLEMEGMQIHWTMLRT